MSCAQCHCHGATCLPELHFGSQCYSLVANTTTITHIHKHTHNTAWEHCLEFAQRTSMLAARSCQCCNFCCCCSRHRRFDCLLCSCTFACSHIPPFTIYSINRLPAPFVTLLHCFAELINLSPLCFALPFVTLYSRCCCLVCAAPPRPS